MIHLEVSKATGGELASFLIEVRGESIRLTPQEAAAVAKLLRAGGFSTAEVYESTDAAGWYGLREVWGE